MQKINILINKISIPFLATLSGICGISYELIYARILSLYFGNMFYISGALLSTFLLGIAGGSFFSKKHYHQLWLFELLIGLYAIIIFLLNHFGQNYLLAFSGQNLESSHLFMAIKIIFILALPAFLMGFSVPSFAILMEQKTVLLKKSSFISAYQWYNLGAGICVLTLELVIIRHLGLEYSLLMVAILNLIIAFTLYFIHFKKVAIHQENNFTFNEKNDLLVIFILGILSGISQIQLVNFGEIFWGPFNENFAIFLSLNLLALWLASLIIKKYSFTLETILRRAYYLFPLGIALIPGIVITYVGLISQTPPVFSIYFKVFFMGIMFFIPFLTFAGVLPAYLQNKSNNKKTVSFSLGLSSLGNTVGYLVSILFLYEYLNIFFITLLIALGLYLSRWLYIRDSKKKKLQSSLFFLLITPIIYISTDHPIYNISYLELINYNTLSVALNQVKASAHFQKYNTKLTLTDYKDGSRHYIINGYLSLVSKLGKTIPHEVIFGILPTLYTDEREGALVLGVGQGITAGTVAKIFNSSKAIEISPAVLLQLSNFKENNFNLHHNSKAKIINDDALTYLLNSKENFPLIISTVTSPIFFSSSNLYTKDFFSLIKKHLTPKGIFAFWFDAQIPKEGMAVIFETVKQSFNECHLAYIKGGYAEVICGQAPLAPKKLIPANLPLEIQKIFLDFYGQEKILANLNYLIFNHHNIMTNDWGGKINSFNLPILEFIISNGILSRTPQPGPFTVAKVDFTSSPFFTNKLNLEQMTERCLTLHIIGYIKDLNCIEALQKYNNMVIPTKYNDEIKKQKALFSL